MHLHGAARGHRVVGAHAVARPTRLAGGLPVNEVFTTTTEAPRGGGRARWGDGILTAMVGQRREGGGGFSDVVPATGSSSGGDNGSGDVLDHREANRG
jgi:hypothetical protein